MAAKTPIIMVSSTSIRAKYVFALRCAQWRGGGAASRPPQPSAPRRGLLDVIPGGQHDDRHQDGGHQDQDKGDAVHADRVVHAELRDPLIDLLELEPRAAWA